MAGRSRKSADTVFGLPNGIFGPLSSPARRDYGQVLLHLYRNHLASNVLLGLDLTRADMVGFLSNALAALDATTFSPDASNQRIADDPTLVYRNLVDAGWFAERVVGSEVLVVLSRPVLDLLRALDGISCGSSVNFTGSLQAMEVALRALGEDPSNGAMMLVVTAQQAEEFSARMHAVSADIRANEGHIVGQSGFGDMISAFFDDFVAHLVSDYKAMKSRYNPLRHAASIVSTVNLYVEDPDVVRRIAEGYVTYGYADDVAGAIPSVLAHLGVVSEVFGSARAVVDDIDAVRLRVEERVARAVRYVDAAAAAETGDVEDVMASLGALANLLGDVALPGSMLMLDDRPFSEDSLAKPRARPNPVSSVGVAVAEHDEALAELARARAAYAERMVPTPDAIEEFVERNLGQADILPLDEFSVEEPREMLLLAAVRSVSTNTDPAVRNRYGVSFGGGMVDGVWSEYRAGVVYRLGSPADPAFGAPAETVGIETEEELV